MKNSHRFSSSINLAIACVILSLTLAGCGDNAGQEGKVSQESKSDKSSHTVSVAEHQAFEKKYTEKCIKSQQTASDSQFTNDQELGKVCGCMAQEISKRISKADATHFLQKNEFPIDLVMMTNAAANTCDTGKK